MMKTALDIVKRFLTPYSERIEDIRCMECGYVNSFPARYLNPRQTYFIACPNCGMQYILVYMWGKWRLDPVQGAKPIHASSGGYQVCGAN